MEPLQEPSEIVVEESDLLIQPKSEELEAMEEEGPPLPEADPDDPMPTLPECPAPIPADGDQPALAQRFRHASPEGAAVPNPTTATAAPTRRCASRSATASRPIRCSRTPLRTSISRSNTSPPPSTLRPIKKPENEDAKRLKLRQAGEREWKDKDGKVLAHGHLYDLHLGRAVIETDSKELVELKLRQLDDDDVCFIAAWYNLPTECTLGNDKPEDARIPGQHVHVEGFGPVPQAVVLRGSAGGALRPHCRTDLAAAISGVHFFTNIALLPYKMGINPPQECQYPLGYYRPGSCAPWMIQPFPLSGRGAATAAAVYTGGVVLIP